MNPASSRNQIGDSAFSLMEMLVAVGIVVTLSLLLTASVKNLTFSARKTESMAVLRGYGVALHSYAADNQSLPGPLYQGQSPLYSSSKNYLSSHIWPYFQREEPANQTIPGWLVPTHFKAWYLRQTTSAKKACYMMSGDTKTRSGDTLRPFGYSSEDTATKIEKANWMRFSTDVDLSRAIAMYEAFATSSAPNRSPKKGEIQNYKATLYFDGHVETEKY